MEMDTRMRDVSMNLPDPPVAPLPQPAPAPSPHGLPLWPPADPYDSVSTQILRENEVTNQRITWTLQLNGFLFTAIALIGLREGLNGPMALFVHWLVPATGACVSLSGLLGVWLMWGVIRSGRL